MKLYYRHNKFNNYTYTWTFHELTNETDHKYMHAAEVTIIIIIKYYTTATNKKEKYISIKE